MTIFTGLPTDANFIMADPPWSFLSYTKTGMPQRALTPHYKVESLEDLMAMPVASLAAKDCCLGMWTFGAHLHQALALGAHWGFTFKTDLLVWVKVGKHDPAVRPISMGFWSRKQVEYMLLFTRGRPKRVDAGVRQLIEAQDHIIYAAKDRHSAKPLEQYERIERLVNGPYTELFARQRRDKWSSWGDQLESVEHFRRRQINELLGLPTPSEEREPVMEDDLL